MSDDAVAIWDEGVPSKCGACERMPGVTEHTLTGRCRLNPSGNESQQPAIPGPMFAKAGISVRGQTMWLDGAKIVASNEDGWLHITVETTDDVIGYAVTVNGKDLPQFGHLAELQKAVEASGLSDQELCDLFDTSVPAVQLWRSGEIEPRPGLRDHVIRRLRELRAE
jgi:hypothetical protein